MPEEVNSPPCPVHGAPPRALHPHNFFGIATVIEEIIDTISGVGTTSFSLSYGYPFNFEGVKALEDLNLTASGIQGGGGSPVITSGVGAGSGLYASIAVILSYLIQTLGLRDLFPLTTTEILQSSVVLPQLEEPSLLPAHRETEHTITGTLGSIQTKVACCVCVWSCRCFGCLVSNQRRRYCSYDDIPPSGDNLNAPPRHGNIWFNQLVGSLFVYDETTSGW